MKIFILLLLVVSVKNQDLDYDFSTPVIQEEEPKPIVEGKF
jgi:hypothetical protein